MTKLSNRVHKVKPSFTLQMATIAADMKSKGMDVINFSVGEPDFNTPSNIIEAGKKAMDDGFTKYTAGPGMIELREAICEKLKRENGISYNPSDILVSNGEKQSLYNACQALFEEGDKVIVFRPYWVSFPEFVRLADAEPILVDTLAEKNFEPDFIFYLSGVDIIENDKLGRLSVSINGCKERDRFVLQYCKDNKIPIQISMGGGYSPFIKDIIKSHSNTFRLAQEIFF